MSSPMFDMPEHFPIDVDADGRGPAFGDDIADTVCWCGAPGCEKWPKLCGRSRDHDLYETARFDSGLVTCRCRDCDAVLYLDAEDDLVPQPELRTDTGEAS